MPNSSLDSVKSAASTIAFDMMKYYTGNVSGQWNIPGILPPPEVGGYYWWQAGAMWNSMINYWHITGDTSYNNVVSEALLFQVGPQSDYMPPNQTKALGNDDQAFWGMAAMSAAEYKFPDPPSNQPQWLALAQAVFNTQVPRWNMDTCGGGLKWQIFTFNSGYNYKNTISNGAFFNIAARLALYTNNATYAEWAIKTWDWTQRIGLISRNYDFYDGSDDNLNCSEINHVQYSYNAGVWLLGAAAMYNYTNGDPLWQERTQGILDRSIVYFGEPKTKIIVEVSCETLIPPTCNTDMKSFKAYLTRWMAATTKWAPFTYNQVAEFLLINAKAAAAQCVGGPNGRSCGLKWINNGEIGVWDGTTGVGEQMSAMEVIQSTLILQTEGPVTEEKGGTSKGDPAAGTAGNGYDPNLFTELAKPEQRDVVGASIVTVTLCLATLTMFLWMSY